MSNKIQFDKEYSFDFDINSETKNTDHLTTSEMLNLVEKITVIAKKDLCAAFILVSSLECNFIRRTRPAGKVTLKYMINKEAVIFSLVQNEKLTAEGCCKIAKIVY